MSKAPRKFTLAHKGALLIFGPLLLFSIFVGTFAVLLNQAEQERKAETRAKMVIAEASSLDHLLISCGILLASSRLTRDPHLQERFENSLQEAREQIRSFDSYESDNAHERELMRRVTVLADQQIDLLSGVSSSIDQFGNPHSFEPGTTVREKLQSVLVQTSIEMSALREHEMKRVAAASSAREEDLIARFLLAGSVLNVVVAFVMALAFHREIILRLEMIKDNSVRLARGDSLHPLLQGTDEIADVDHNFHDMAKALDEANKEKDRLTELKSQVLAIVSHDLRTPLTSIHAFLSMLCSGLVGEIDAAAKQGVAVAERNSLHLLRMVTDLLNIEKLEAGQMQMVFSNVDLEKIIEHSVELVEQSAGQRGVDIDAEGTGARVYADAQQIEHVIFNLLSNAVKYSPEGGLVSLKVLDHATEVEIRITDQGRGVPMEFREKIFDRFEQVEIGDAKLKGGTGLGLAICKSIVLEHEGSIGVDSEPGKGSTFWVKLPRSQSDTLRMEVRPNRSAN